MVSGGSLYRLYSELEGNVLSSQNVAFVLGLIRVCVWPEEEWFLNDVSLFVRKEENGIDDARSAMLSLFTECFVRLDCFLQQTSRAKATREGNAPA